MKQVAVAHERLPLNRIEAELARVLHSFQEPGELVHRARMSNLVIFCNDPARAEEVQQYIPQIIATHPARVILAIHEQKTHGEEEALVTGSVTAWCVAGQEKDHICSEQVNLYSGGRTADHLIFAIRGLLTGDLPTNIWWASQTPPALAGALLNEAAERAHQIIYDSNGWMEPARGVAATAAWIQSLEDHRKHDRWRVISDVNWRRLKYWRRLLTQALDPKVLPGAIESISEVQIVHGPHSVIQAWLLVSWLVSRLGWRVVHGNLQPGVEISWRVQTRKGHLTLRIDRRAEGPSEVLQVRVHCLIDGVPGILRLAHVEEDRLAAVTEGKPVAARTLTARPQPLEELVARQLSDREKDPVFRESMAVAETLARSVLNR